MKPLSVLLAAALLASCVASGTKVTEEQLFGFERGRTSYFDVVSTLGKPNASTLHSDGTREVHYMYTQAQVKAINYVPFAAMFAQGSTSETTTVSLYFDARGRLLHYTASQGQTAVGTGFSSGAKQ